MPRAAPIKKSDVLASSQLDGLFVHVDEAAAAFQIDGAKLRTLLNKDAVRTVGGNKYPLVPTIRSAFTYVSEDHDASMAIAGLLGVSQPTVSAMIEQGYFSRRADGLISRTDALLGYIKRLKDQNVAATRNSKDSKQRVESARAREIELRIAREEAVLVEVDEIGMKIDTAFGKLREELSGLPARVTRDLQLRKTLETAINEALTAAADAFGSDATVLSEEADGEDFEADGNNNQAEQTSAS